MRRTWMLGALVLAGCMTRVVTPGPVMERRDTVIVAPAPAPAPAPAAVEPPGHGGTPPGQDPNFVPPGHGGTPPGQAKKEAAMEATPAAVVDAPPAEEASSEDEKPGKSDKSKGKKKGKKK